MQLAETKETNTGLNINRFFSALAAIIAARENANIEIVSIKEIEEERKRA